MELSLRYSSGNSDLFLFVKMMIDFSSKAIMRLSESNSTQLMTAVDCRTGKPALSNLYFFLSLDW